MGYLILAAILFTPSHAVATTTPVVKELTIEEQIEQEAIKRNYSPKRAVAIAKAESNLIPTAKNKISTASGLYQFIDGTFKYYCIEKYKYAQDMSEKNNPDIQIQCALTMLSNNGESHWSESRHVWGSVW